MGPEPAAGLVELRRNAARELIEAIGVPSPLFVPNSTEGAQRAAWRRYLSATVEPVARMIAAELSAKLEQPVALDVAALAPPDAVASVARGRARRRTPTPRCGRPGRRRSARAGGASMRPLREGAETGVSRPHGAVDLRLGLQ